MANISEWKSVKELDAEWAKGYVQKVPPDYRLNRRLAFLMYQEGGKFAEAYPELDPPSDLGPTAAWTYKEGSRRRTYRPTFHTDQALDLIALFNLEVAPLSWLWDQGGVGIRVFVARGVATEGVLAGKRAAHTRASSALVCAALASFGQDPLDLGGG